MAADSDHSDHPLLDPQSADSLLFERAGTDRDDKKDIPRPTMSKMFRSEDMTYMETIIPTEAVRGFVYRLAVLGCAQLSDVRAACLFLLLCCLFHCGGSI